MDIEIFQKIVSKHQLATNKQTKQLHRYAQLLQDKNQHLNLVSRKDIDQVCTHHILHSILIGVYFHFHPQQRVLDLGTGGGLPGIPLAILFPESHFTLVDSMHKKIKTVQEFSEQLNLKNITPLWARAEKLHAKYDTVISRAVTSLPKLTQWSTALLTSKSIYNSSGLIVLKGGDIHDEIATLPYKWMLFELSKLVFPHIYFQEKYILYCKRLKTI